MPAKRRRVTSSPEPSPAGAGGVIVSLLGWVAVLGGGAWALLAVMFMGLDVPEATLTLLIASPGALAALVGLGMILLGADRGSSRRS